MTLAVTSYRTSRSVPCRDPRCGPGCNTQEYNVVGVVAHGPMLATGTTSKADRVRGVRPIAEVTQSLAVDPEMPARHGAYSLIGAYLDVTKHNRWRVRVRCDCGTEQDIDRSTWMRPHAAPKNCAACNRGKQKRRGPR